MTTIENLKTFFDIIPKDGCIYEIEGEQFIAFDTRLEKSDIDSHLSYLALLLIDNAESGGFNPHAVVLEVRNLRFDERQKKVYMEMADNRPIFSTLSGIIRWQDQQQFDKWKELILNDDEAKETVSEMKASCLRQIREQDTLKGRRTSGPFTG